MPSQPKISATVKTMAKKATDTTRIRTHSTTGIPSADADRIFSLLMKAAGTPSQALMSAETRRRAFAGYAAHASAIFSGN